LVEQSFQFLEYYFKQKFQGKKMVCHRTSAIDTSSCKRVWDAVMIDIKERALKGVMAVNML